MNADTRSQKIETFGTAYQQLVSALARFPREMWQYRPAPNRWTVHEIIIHITDSEANSYIRCRRFLAEPGGTVLGYDDQNTDESLELFNWLRRKSYTLIKDLPEPVWSNTVHH